MYGSKTVAVVVPCFNEERQIRNVLATMPDFVDLVIVVDDASTDCTVERVDEFLASQAGGGEVVLLTHEKNEGVGRAISTGYQLARKRGIDVTAVMAGDGQMDPDELELLVEPIASGRADYAKGNRLFHRTAWESIPRHRYLGNALLSMLTKIASGYWHSADSQCGFTAISLDALRLIDVEAIYPRYGYPNDILVRLNLYGLSVTDVPIRPVYNIGERSTMQIWKVIPTIAWLIFKLFLWRLREKHIIHDFHPLVLFYAIGGVALMGGTAFGFYLLWLRMVVGAVSATSALFSAFLVMSGLQLLLFAMWFDMQNNRDLRVVSRPVLKEVGPRRREVFSEPDARAA